MTKHSDINPLVDHLFRHEAGKMVAVLTRIFGAENLSLVEDVVQDALVEAIRQWTYKGVPDNPTAWLFTVAKNKALNAINREKTKRRYSSKVARALQPEPAEPGIDPFLSEEVVLDDQLRMMFTCCHPAISPDSQVALTLKTLCGFGISEIAKAFLTTNENINKRLVRARQKIREDKIPFLVPEGAGLGKRLQSVLETIYLLFNEGYSASAGTDLIRYEICEEAIRLAELLVSHPAIPYKSDIYALLALMQLNSARFSARQDGEGNIITLEHQDRALWDCPLMEQGFSNLGKSMSGNQLTKYHILAAISACHCSAVQYALTDWKKILALYDQLAQIDNSPVVQLNRAIALSKVSGAEKAIAALEKIDKNPAIKTYHLFHSTQAVFYMELHQFAKAIPSLDKAVDLAPLQSEKKLLLEKIAFCREKIL